MALLRSAADYNRKPFEKQSAMQKHGTRQKDLSIPYVYHEKVKTLIVLNVADCEKAIKLLLSYRPTIVGFDMEWKCTPKGQSEAKTSLMQIAFDNKLIILIRMHLLHAIPRILLSFLSQWSILKCGCGIHDDRKKLYNDYRITVRGCVDLNDLYLTFEPNHVNNGSKFGLNAFSNNWLSSEMKYKQGINHWKWESKHLSKKQIDYAANDALVGYQVFMVMFRFACPKNGKQSVVRFCQTKGIIDRHQFEHLPFLQLEAEMVRIATRYSQFALSELATIYHTEFGKDIRLVYRKKFKPLIAYYDDLFLLQQHCGNLYVTSRILHDVTKKQKG
mmetsp:Transcript_34062/g.55529  ORF Transcript_34062/g.55529 Transcript_34062/m.55529 type:complete len:331 (-) Transcript_34062:20-1012(-)